MPPELRDRLQEESTAERAELEAVWDLLQTMDDAPGEDADPERAWRAITDQHPELAEIGENGRVDAETGRTDFRADARRRQRPLRQPSHGRRRQWTIGLVLAMLLLVGGIWLWNQSTTVTAPPGQQHTTTLPDGSTVELNSGSTISYDRGFQAWPLVEANRRVVHLKGEAFFDVTERGQAFLVETENAEVSVLGTQFNVRARSTEYATEITVLRGSVRVSPQGRPEKSVVLADSGQTSRVTDSGVTLNKPRSTNVDRVLAWRHDGFAAHAKPLSSVIDELERRYAEQLELDSSVSRTDAPVSLYYPGPTELETILHDLCTARDLKYRSTREGFTVFATPRDR